MKEGSIVEVAFQQKDGKIKLRPAVLLKKMPPYDDWLVCAISGSVDLEVKGFDLVISESHPDFQLSRLRYPGLIRLGLLSTIPSTSIVGATGYLSEKTIAQLLKNLAGFLTGA